MLVRTGLLHSIVAWIVVLLECAFGYKEITSSRTPHFQSRLFCTGNLSIERRYSTPWVANCRRKRTGPVSRRYGKRQNPRSNTSPILSSLRIGILESACSTEPSTDRTPRNQKETLSQNYRRLGLVSKLNHAAGGVEKSTASTTSTPANDQLKIASKSPANIAPAEARIERDPGTGAIIRVVNGPASKPNPLNDPLNIVEDEDGARLRGLNEHHIDGAVGNTPGQGEIVRILEQQARNGERPAERKQSAREQAWIESLVAKHGDDYHAMFMDRNLNVMQQSEGDIKRRARKYTAGKSH